MSKGQEQDTSKDARETTVETISVGNGIARKLRQKYGNSVRAIATYNRDGYNLRYSSNDFDEEYETNDVEKIYEDFVLQEINSELQEDLFEDMGDTKGEIRLFDEGFVAHFWPTEEEDGLFISFRGEAEVSLQGLCELLENRYG